MSWEIGIKPTVVVEGVVGRRGGSGGRENVFPILLFWTQCCCFWSKPVHSGKLAPSLAPHLVIGLQLSWTAGERSSSSRFKPAFKVLPARRNQHCFLSHRLLCIVLLLDWQHAHSEFVRAKEICHHSSLLLLLLLLLLLFNAL